MADRALLRVHVLIDALGWGGAEMLLGDFALGAREAGLELSVTYLFDRDGSPAAARLRSAGVAPVGIGVTGLLDRSDHGRLRRRLAETRPQVIHTHLAYADVFGGLAARALGRPAVSTLHVMRWEPGVREAIKLRLSAEVRRRCMSSVIAVSESARSAYLERGWDRPGHVLAVPNGIVGSRQAGAGAVVRAQLGLGPQDLVVTMLAVLREHKGHDVAIAAASALRERFPALTLLIAGDGPARPAVQAWAAAVPGKTRLIGHREDVMALLDATDVLVHPSAVDAFPTALLEAMAAGVPVLASRVGGIPEIVEEGSTGLMVEVPVAAGELAGRLSDLLANRDLRAEMGVRARQRFEAEFTAARWAERLRELYLGLRSRRTRGEAFSAKRRRPSPR